MKTITIPVERNSNHVDPVETIKVLKNARRQQTEKRPNRRPKPFRSPPRPSYSSPLKLPAPKTSVILVFQRFLK